MTPAERLCEPLFRYFFPKAERTGYIRPEHYEPLATIVLDALCPKGERVVIDRTGDTDRLAEPFNIELLTERLRLANARLLAYDGDPRVRPRLEAKAEGVRLALSYISDMTREDGPDE